MCLVDTIAGLRYDLTLFERLKILELVPCSMRSFIQAQKLNQTGTMRMMDENELRVILRGALAMVRSDFLEQNPYFGSAAHKKLMLDSMVRLFQK